MLAFRVMRALRRGGGASFLAFIAAFLTLQCGEEEFNLLSAGQTDAPPPATGGRGTGLPTGGTTGGAMPAGTGGATTTGGGGTGGRSAVPPPPPPWGPCDSDEYCRNLGAPPFCVAERCVQCRDEPNEGCGPGFTCSHNFCLWACRNDGGCPPGYLCAPERGGCVECFTGVECDEAFPFCVDNFCAECRRSADCNNGERCLYNRCDD